VALADTARLVASLELRDKFSAGLKSAGKSLDGFETRMGRIGGIASRGVGAAANNIAKLGVVVGAGLGAAIKTGLDDLATLENATTSVDGAIAQLGLTGQLTSQQVATWANDIERDIGAAFDDKAIVSAATTLLRFGKVTPNNLQQTLEVMTDLATKTGSVDSAAALLAKALADPTKAAGRLTRAGIILTKAEQKQVKALVKAGKAGEAQALVLDIIAKSTEGAAKASQGPYKRALSILADVSEDAKKALAEGFLPVIERVAKVLSEKLGDPVVIEQIRGLGRGLAGAFDRMLTAAEKIPWGSIGDAMRLAGQGAKAALDLFTGLPPWVQTAVLTGWGLNKLTGGALGAITAELGKGLIKGVLGMNAGVVNIKAGVVTGAGGVPGVPAAAAGAGTLGLGAALGIATVSAGAAAVIGVAVADAMVGAENRRFANKGLNAEEVAAMRYYTASAADQSTIAKRLGRIPTREQWLSAQAKLNTPDKAHGGLSPDERDEKQRAAIQATTDAIQRAKDSQDAHLSAATKAIEDARAATNDKVPKTTRAVEIMKARLAAETARNTGATVSQSGFTRNTIRSGTGQIVGAIRSIPAPITNVNVNVTAAHVTKAVTYQSRYGPGTGSGGTNYSGAMPGDSGV
jgi:hypothetical protein